MTAGDPVPVSAIPGAVWPAVPAAAGSVILAVQYQLQRSQWWPPERLAECQFAQIRPLVGHAWERMPFYRERFAAAGFEPARDDLREAWPDLPVTTRAELQALGDDFKASAVPAAHGAVTRVQTSGSTGRPLTAFATELCRILWSACTLRDHQWHRRDLSGKLATIRIRGERYGARGVDLPDWGPPASAVYQTGPSALFSIVRDVDLQRRWLIRQDPDYLLSHPSNLRALADCFERAGGELRRLSQVRTMGEMLPADLRDACRRVWGVGVADMYSSEEVGYIALQCPDHEHYHVQSENVLVEVLDDAGRACGPGETGRVVLTVLHNYASPLIRYEIKDYAEVGEPCPCGRGLPVLRRIVGRQRNMVVRPDGTRSWPGFGARTYLDIAPIEQLQLVQTELDRVEARIVIARPMTEAERAAFRTYLQSRLGYPFVVDFTFVDEIERGPGGKFEDFVSRVAG